MSASESRVLDTAVDVCRPGELDCLTTKSPVDRVHGGDTTRVGRKQYWQRANLTPTGGVTVAHA